MGSSVAAHGLFIVACGFSLSSCGAGSRARGFPDCNPLEGRNHFSSHTQAWLRAGTLNVLNFKDELSNRNRR